MEQTITVLLNEFEQGRIPRRELIQKLLLTACSVAALPVLAAESKGFHATGVNHLSFSVPDYAKTRDFYADLLGLQVRGDTGDQCTLGVGDSFIVVRKSELPDRKAYVDHFAISIDGWDKEAVEAELTRRGLRPMPDGERSFHVKDPDGFDLQISGARQKR